MFKKYHFVVVIFFFATGFVYGQYEQRFKFGILAAPTITWLRPDVKDIIRDKARMGLDIGMIADYYFSRNYAFSTGISLYNTGGTLIYTYKYNLHTNDGTVTFEEGGKVKYKVMYVKIPAALKFKTHMIGRIIYSANLGFDPMLRVSTRADFNDERNVKLKDETRLLNMGWHFGGEAQYSLGGDASLFGGLSFMNTFMDMTQPTHGRITSNNLIFRIGIMF